MASLLTAPFTQIEDANGNPLSGGKIYTYVTGASLTPKATYTSEAATTPLPNPVILDSNGAAQIWLSGAYRLRIFNAADVLMYDVDNVSSDASATTTFTDSTFEIVDNGDATKKMNFELSSLTTGTTRTVTMPNKSGTMAMLSDIGGAVLLSTQTVGSAVATVDFTIPAGYTRYVFTGENIAPATSGNVLRARVSVDNGVSYVSANYLNSSYYTSDAGSTAQNTGTANIALTANPAGPDTSGNSKQDFELTITMPATTGYKNMNFISTTYTGSVLYNCYGSAIYNGATTAITNMRFYESAGNIASGTFKLYGVS